MTPPNKITAANAGIASAVPLSRIALFGPAWLDVGKMAREIEIPVFMLALMTGPYLVARCLSFFSKREFDSRSAAAVGLGILFVFTGIGHFTQTLPMSRMLPPWVPYPTILVYLSGILEFAIALGFFISKTRRLAGWMALGILILFFPVNIYAAFNYVEMGGHVLGPVYLLVRGPLQLIILLWVYFFTIKSRTNQLQARSGSRLA